MKIEIGKITIEAVQGNIVEQDDLQAVVNAANAQLSPGGGVAGAMHNAAGPELYESCKSLAPIQPGEAVVTKAFKLPNNFVIHCLGPVYGRDQPEDQFLASCYANTFRICEEKAIESVGFPAISTGIFGYPIFEAVDVVFNTVQAAIPEFSSLKKIRFVLFSAEDLKVYEEKLAILKS